MEARAATAKTAPTLATLDKAAVMVEREAIVPQTYLAYFRQMTGARLFSAAKAAQFSSRPPAISSSTARSPQREDTAATAAMAGLEQRVETVRAGRRDS